MPSDDGGEDGVDAGLEVAGAGDFGPSDYSRGNSHQAFIWRAHKA